MKSWSVTIQMKATEQYFPVVLLIIRSRGNRLLLLLYAEQGDSNFWIDQEMYLQAWPFKWKLLSSAFL